MNAEIIAVGTEILLGQISNTNAAYLSEQLAALGINVYWQTVVGDNRQRLSQAVQTAEGRSDLVITIGGLGPTDDDLTKEVVAAYLKVDLVPNEMAAEKIATYQKRTGKMLTTNNAKQALMLKGARPLANLNGYAVGDFYANPDGADFVLLPGPPREFKKMVDSALIPILQEQSVNPQLLSSKVMRFFGIGESQLVADLADLIAQQTNPTIAPYAKPAEVTLRITASGSSIREANQLIDEIVSQILARDGDYFYGYGDDNSLAAVVVKDLVDQHLTITAAESLTAGEFQSTLGDVPGVSAVFPGGFVTYANSAKEQLLSIPPEIVDQYGVVSETVAIWMAKMAKEKMGTDVAVSFTGVAGPDELEGHPAGTVWIGLAYQDREPQAFLYQFNNGRQQIRDRSVLTGLDLVRREIKKA